MFKFLDKER